MLAQLWWKEALAEAEGERFISSVLARLSLLGASAGMEDRGC